MMNQDEIDAEARLMGGVTAGLIALFNVFHLMEDSVAIIYIYLGWCLYIMVFSINFRRKQLKKYDGYARNKRP